MHPHPIDWLHIQSSFESVRAKQNNGNNLPLIPANKINTTLKANFDIKNVFKKAYFTINVEKILKQNKISAFETASKGYSLVNLGFGGTYKLKKTSFDFSLNANNLFDTKYISHLSRLKVDAIPNPGRNISVGIDFTF